MATRSGFEPPISALTGQYVNRYTTGPGGNAVWFQGCLGMIIRRAGGFVKWYRAAHWGAFEVEGVLAHIAWGRVDSGLRRNDEYDAK